MSSPGGILLVDRHIEKNAGSTFRELLWKAESNGLCLYWGYLHRSTAWGAFVKAMSNLGETSTPPRLCLEAHSGIDERIPWLERLKQLSELRATFKLRKVPMRTLLLLSRSSSPPPPLSNPQSHPPMTLLSSVPSLRLALLRRRRCRFPSAAAMDGSIIIDVGGAELHGTH